MTFYPKKTADVRMIHYTLSSDATIAHNGKIIFNSSSASSSGSNVSFDGSGNLTLDEKCSYYMILSPDVVRNLPLSSNRYIDISMYDSSGNQLLPNTGASNVEFRATTANFSNFSLIVTLKNPNQTYSFRYTNSNSNSATLKTGTHLMIMEFY